MTTLRYSYSSCRTFLDEESASVDAEKVPPALVAPRKIHRPQWSQRCPNRGLLSRPEVIGSVAVHVADR